MPVSSEFRDYLLDLLAPLEAIEAKRMFGGAGLFHQDVMFALIAQDVVYFKVDERNQERYAAAGMAPFSYQRAGRARALGSYWRVPDEVLEDEDEFLTWAGRAIEVAFQADRAKGAKARRRG